MHMENAELRNCWRRAGRIIEELAELGITVRANLPVQRVPGGVVNHIILDGIRNLDDMAAAEAADEILAPVWEDETLRFAVFSRAIPDHLRDDVLAAMEETLAEMSGS